MMEHKSLDPYEQQLLKVFDSYDYENRGSLDRDGLMQLCQTLQLEEGGNELIKCLLNDKKHTRATFVEFKEALLALLGNIQNTNDNASDFDGSPEREVSPKFVYGSKKYGRRSRPRNDEISPVKERNETKYVNKTVHNVSVQRSNSQNDVMYSKKRKTNTNLKRCTSFPGNHLFEYHRSDTFVTPNNFVNSHELVCTESMLREAWKKLGVGKDGYLNQTELILVCDAIGLRKLANGVLRQLSGKLIGDFDHKISFQELLEALQQDEAWVDVLNSTPTNTEDTLSLNLSSLSSDSVFLNTKSVQFVTLGPKGNGYINAETVIEMWESAGITSPRLLLSDLGFTSSDIDIVELASVLEKEIKGINETRSDFSNPHIALLQAVLCLYQSEIRYLKNIMEQMQAEREKLKSDVTEANNRATLLAQEVDDNHAKMERNTQNQVKHLEQRHAEILKELTERCSSEKDQLAMLNQNLKLRIAQLENEAAMLRNDLHLAQKYLTSIEKENQNLSGQIMELEQIREMLNDQVRILENEKQKHQETEQVQMESLIAKLSTIQIENSRLRDKNDEMLSEIESLNAEMSVLRMKISNTSVSNIEPEVLLTMEENITVICEGIGHGSKRRSDDSPSKDFTVFGLGEESPRLGKVRKFHKNNEVLEIPFTSSESGFETELDCVDSSLSNSCENENEEIMRLQAKISILEQILNDHSIQIPSSFSPQSEGDTALRLKHTDIKQILNEVKTNVNKILVTNQNCDVIKNINEKLNRLIEKTDNEVMVDETKVTNNVNTETGDDNDDIEQKLEKYVALNKVLNAESDELKNCLEMLECEYEKCEKYWASTLEEERKVFEQEQNQYSEHLGQLMQKISEFDEEFIRKDKRLSPIEEKCNLEEQFTDLEHEFEDYRIQVEIQMDEKDREIIYLKEQLDELITKVKQTTEMSIQTDYLQIMSIDMESKKHNLSNHVIESTNLFPSDTMPFTLTVQNISEHISLDTCALNNVSHCDYINSDSVWNKGIFNKDYLSGVDNGHIGAQHSLEETNTTLSLPVNMSFQTLQNDLNQSLSLYDLHSMPIDATCSGVQKNTIPLRPKRTRKHERNPINQKLYNKNSNENTQNNVSNMNQEDTVTVPVSTIHNLNAKLHHLEQRCRHLQLVLKEQYYHSEQVLQHYWQQQRLEKSELQLLLKSTQEKLERESRFCSEQFERLARTDLLVKDLYVENAFLLANVQRLEQKCHILTQCNSTNSV